MNKQAIIAVLATLFFTICMPNSTMAKKSCTSIINTKEIFGLTMKE